MRVRLLVALLVAVVSFETGAVSPAIVLANEPSESLALEAEPSADSEPSADPPPSDEPASESPQPEPSAVPAERLPEPVADDDPPPGLEVVELRTANSRTFEQPDGSYLSEFFSGAIHYQPEGTDEWQPIELVFEPADELAGRGEVEADVEAISARSPVELSVAPAEDQGGFIRLAGDGHALAPALDISRLVPREPAPVGPATPSMGNGGGLPVLRHLPAEPPAPTLALAAVGSKRKCVHVCVHFARSARGDGALRNAGRART